MYNKIKNTVLSSYRFNLISSVAFKKAISLDNLNTLIVFKREIAYNESESESSETKSTAKSSNGTVDRTSSKNMPLM